METVSFLADRSPVPNSRGRLRFKVNAVVATPTFAVEENQNPKDQQHDDRVNANSLFLKSFIHDFALKRTLCA